MPLEKNQPDPFRTDRGPRRSNVVLLRLRRPNDSPTAENLKQIIELRPGKPAVADEAP